VGVHALTLVPPKFYLWDRRQALGATKVATHHLLYHLPNLFGVGNAKCAGSAPLRRALKL